VLAFERPWVLAFLCLVPLFLFLSRLLRAGSGAAAFPLSDGFADFPSAPLPRRFLRLLRATAFCLGLAAVVAAAAGPELVTKRVLYLDRGNEAIIVLDVSPSMAASDFTPTRLDAAKAIIGDFLATRRNETVGLVAFGGEAALVCPPTTDYRAVAARLATLQPGIYGEGTAIGAGLATAIAHAARSSAPGKEVILLTDGENNQGAMDPQAALRAAARFGVGVSAIGVGSSGEAPIAYVDPVTKQKRSGIYRSSFDGAALEALLRSVGGNYYGADNRAALASAFAGLAERSVSLTTSRIVSSSRGFASQLLGLGLALLVLARLLGLAGGSGRP
jgi:Ca-activated chloride channel homolog